MDARTVCAIDVKKTFLRFYSCHVFTFLTFFYFVNVFIFLKKRSLKKAKSVHKVVNCNKLNKDLFASSSRYPAPTALGIRQEVEEIRANGFYSTFFKVFLCLPRFFTFLTFFHFFLERFYINGLR